MLTPKQARAFLIVEDWLSGVDIAGLPKDKLWTGYGEAAGVHKSIDPADVLGDDGLYAPANINEGYACTRKTFSYPYMNISFDSLPTYTTDNIEIWIGFSNPISLVGGNNNKYRLHTQGGAELEVQDHMPSDYDTDQNWYTLKVGEQRGELWINDTYRGVVLSNLPENIPTWTGKPYSLGGDTTLSFPKAPVQLVAVDFSDHDTPTRVTYYGRRLYEDWGLAVREGSPLPPVQFRVYTENSSTKWQGSSLSGTVQSHPVPVWGYPNKTLYFKSGAAGTLRVQIYVGGGWVTRYEKSLTADELFVYTLDEEVPIARCEYVATNSDAIDVAEWYLS